MRILSIFILLFTVSSTSVYSQVLETKNWCLSKCDAAGDEKANFELVSLKMKNDSIKNLHANDAKLKVPLRIGIIQTDTQDVEIKELTIRKGIDKLNESFAGTNLIFYIKKTDVIYSELKLEDLSQNAYEPYNKFSRQYDLENILSIYIFDHRDDFCKVSNNTISCGRTGGFSYVLSDLTSNLVMSRFDISDVKVLAHEMGHFWGLYHTFEEYQFGKDNFDSAKCSASGDRICDTPPDPGPLYEIYVNYTDCEYKNLKHDNGADYKPLIQNYMSYYKPCYLKEYSFTPGQEEVMRTAASLPIRLKYIELD